MQEPDFERFAILGAGLMGASLGLALKAAGAAREVRVCDPAPAALQAAGEIGAGHHYTADLAEAVGGAEAVCLAAPVGVFDDLLARAAPLLSRGCILTDVGSVKAVMARRRHPALPRHVALVPGHPIAGAAESGARAARAEMFRGARVVLTPEPEEPRAAVSAIVGMWRRLGAEPVEMTAEDHDSALAWTSHLPQAAASALMSAVGDAAGRRPEIWDLAGPGLHDSTRIAGSDPAIWADILIENRAAAGRALEAYQGRLAALRSALGRGDRAAVRDLVASGRSARRRLEDDDGDRER